jgi:ferredoxin like protein
MVTTTLDEKLASVRFRVDEFPHILVNNEICSGCSIYVCTYVCPANLFTLLNNGSILFNYEHCFECGTCYIACPQEGAIQWSYPRGGYGVTFRDA